MKTEIDIYNKWFSDEMGITEAMILNAIKEGIEEGKEQQVKNLLPDFEKKLEDENKLITEAVADVMTIAQMNGEMEAKELIRKQFIVINRQDISEE